MSDPDSGETVGEPPAFFKRESDTGEEFGRVLERAARARQAVRVKVRYEPTGQRPITGTVTFRPSVDDPLGSYYKACKAWIEIAGKRAEQKAS